MRSSRVSTSAPAIHGKIWFEPHVPLSTRRSWPDFEAAGTVTEETLRASVRVTIIHPITGSITPPVIIEPDETEIVRAIDPIGEVSVRFSRD